MDDDDPSSDESSKGRTSRYSDDSLRTEGDTPAPSEPGSLLKLVRSRRPDVDNARNRLSDLTPVGVTEELNAKDSRGNSAIHYACIKGLVPWLELIIEQGGDVDVKGAGGRRPIHLVVRDEASSETQAQDKVKMIELLASKGVLVNEKDDLGQTSLQLACNHSESRGQKMVIQALLSLSDIKVDEPVKVGGVNSTLLNIACHNNHFETALLLVDHGANPLTEDGSKNTPLFIILTEKNVKFALRFLTTCEKKGCDMRDILSVKNVYGKTALHHAIKIGNEPLIKYCLPFSNPLTEDGSKNTPLFIILTKKKSEYALPFLTTCEKKGYDMRQIGHEPLIKYCLPFLAPDDEGDEPEGHDYLLGFTTKYGTNLMHTACRKRHLDLAIMILKLCPKLLDMKMLTPKSRKEFLNEFDYIFMGNSNDEEIERITLRCARKGQTESLEQFFAWRKDAFLFEDNENNNVMHLVAQGGHLDTAKAMLKKDDVEFTKWGRSNPHSTTNKLGQTPLHIAIKEGHRELTKLFLKADRSLAGEKDKSNMTPLMYACRRGDLFNVDLLLKYSQKEIKFFDCDGKGLNCLDHAINNGHERVAVRLLSPKETDGQKGMNGQKGFNGQKYWRRLLTHSTIEGGTKTTPMRKLIEKMPGVGKFVLDKCITGLSDTSTDSKDTCKIKVDYELLEDWFSPWMADDSLGNTRGTSLSQGGPEDTSSATGAQVSTNFGGDDDTSSATGAQKATRPTYWINFVNILTLLILVTCHSLLIPPPFYVQAYGGGSNYTWLADGQTKWEDNLNPIAVFFVGKVSIWIILALTIAYFVLFFQRVWMYKDSTVSSFIGSLSMLREIIIQVFTILFILPGFSDHQYYDVTIKAEWQWQLGAFAVFLTWFNFILSLQTAPFVGIYVHMFLEVLTTLLSFILVAGIFILSFALVFFILLSNQVPFHTLWDSLGKVLAMTTGDIDYSDVFHNLDYLYKPVPSEDFTSMVFYPISTHIIFVIFIIFMPILIMNLLPNFLIVECA
eukprot:XP_011670924.1 PREDICTED: transient receptor potential cation channel subfamily A member 1-like [Strongylocentrotus purpuratus]